MAIGIDNMFDLGNLLFNELAGDFFIGLIGGLFIVWFMSIKLKMPMEASIVFGLLFLLIITIYQELPIVIIFVTLFIGVLFYYGVSKLINK